jgi:thiamine biosynthesis lipoprotein
MTDIGSEPARGIYLQTVAAMGTVVSIQVVGAGNRSESSETIASVERACGWFRRVEDCCSRFQPASELMQLTEQPGVAVAVSPMLFEAVRFAIAVADASGGAFDPTIGHAMEMRGFNRDDRTGRIVRSPVEAAGSPTYRDVLLDPSQQTIRIARPLVLDLGAVAKGLAIDMAARELQPIGNFAIDAGGDLYLGGRNPQGRPWSVGVRHPRDEHRLIDSLSVSDRAVCTSGDYERRSTGEHQGHHILDPRTGMPTEGVASVTVVAPTAMLADALGTAAFVLGPARGMRLLERHGVEGLMVTTTLERYRTRGMPSDDDTTSDQSARSGSAIPGHPQRPAHSRAGAARRPGGAGRRRRPDRTRAR